MPHAETQITASPPAGHLACTDNLTFMQRLPDRCCDLIYADPPFMFDAERAGIERRGSGRNAATGRHDDLLGFLEPRLLEMHRLLAEHGSLYVHLDWRSVHYVKVALDCIFGPAQFLNEIIWSYRSGGRPAAWFSRKHDTILLYAKCNGKHTFNRMRDGAYRTRDLLFDSEGRPYKSTRNGPVYFNPDGPAVADVWDIPILSTVARERTGYPSQKPEALLERIVRTSSNENDTVADFFCGSGTALAVAARLGRRWIGCDVNPDAVAVAQARLDRTKKNAARGNGATS